MFLTSSVTVKTSCIVEKCWCCEVDDLLIYQGILRQAGFDELKFDENNTFKGS